MSETPTTVTADEWLKAVLESGQVTRIGQHLALVVYAISKLNSEVAKLSSRDLERITGWGKSTIADHLSELEVFMSVTWGKGRAKHQFELQYQGVSFVREPDTTEISVRQPASLPDSKPDTNSFVRDTDILPDSRTPFNYPYKDKTLTINKPIDSLPLTQAVAVDDFSGLNGSAEPMLRDIARWMHNGDERGARMWLGDILGQFGKDIVRNGYTNLKTNMAEGNPVAHPLRYWTRTMQTMKAKGPSNRPKLSRWGNGQ